MSAEGQPANSLLLAVGQLTKLFGTFAACRRNQSRYQAGAEIHALLGENGAGKSTLVKMLFGVLAPTSGQIVWQGQPVRIASPSAARKLGIGMVFQHFSLFEGADGRRKYRPVRWIPAYRWRGSPRRRPIRRMPMACRWIRMRMWPTFRWASASGSKSSAHFCKNPKLIILDEPTSVLTPQEADRLFETLNKLKAEGAARSCTSATGWKRCSASATAPPFCATAR